MREKKDEEHEPSPVEPSAVSRELQRLKSKAFTAVNTRSRLPQPLFWSLFHTQIAQLKKRKEKGDAVRRLLFD